MPNSRPPVSASARRVLLTGPAGSGKSHRALGMIQAAVAKPESDPGALLLLPTYAQVLHVKRLALSRWGTRGILDAPFTTFTAAGERFVPGFHVRSLPSGDERDRLMEAALRRADVSLFHEVADRAGFRARLLRLVKEVKQSGLPVAEALRRLAQGHAELDGAAADRLAGFIQVFRAYDQLLRTAGLEDHEDSLRRLLEVLASATAAHVPGLLVVDGFDDFTPVEERILRVLADAVCEAGGNVYLTLPFDPARADLVPGAQAARERWLDAGFVEEACTGFHRSEKPGLVALAAHLFNPPAQPCGDATGVTAIVAGDAEDEALQVAREIRRLVCAARDGTQGHLPLRGWRDVGVIVRRTEDVAPRFEAAFAAMGVPLRVVGPGRPLVAEPPVRALRGPFAVLAGRVEAGRFEARPVTAWLRWRAAMHVEHLRRDAIDAWELRHRSEGFPSTWSAYMADAPESLLPWLDELLAAVLALGEAVRDRNAHDVLRGIILSLTPLPDSLGVDADGRPIDPTGDQRLRRATAARARLAAMPSALHTALRRTQHAELDESLADVSASDVVDSVLEAIDRAQVSLPDRRLDVVNLMDAEEARFWEFQVAFVADLGEGRFPLHPREDILLRDADRDALRACDARLALPLVRDLELRERRLFHGALTRARSALVLVRSAYDADGDPKGASFFLRDVARVLHVPRVGLPPRPGRVAVPRVTCVSRADLVRFAAWAGEAPDLSADDRRVATALRQAVAATGAARAARNLRACGDALLGPDGALPDTTRERFAARAAILSVSRLNLAVRCPHRFFLAEVLGLPQDDVPFDGPGFDLRKEGVALHRALEFALREPGRPAAEVAQQVAEREELDPLARRLLLAELTRVVDLFRARESTQAEGLLPVPQDLEFAFGEGGDIRLGSGDGVFALRGKVDRMDSAGGRASLIDYKSSKDGCDSAAKAARLHTDLQLPLYARAISTSRGLDVCGVEWMAIRTRARRIIHAEPAAALFEGRAEGVGAKVLPGDAFAEWIDAAEQLASDTVRDIRAGAHVKAPADAAVCKDCAWHRTCRPDAANWESRPGTDDVSGGVA